MPSEKELRTLKDKVHDPLSQTSQPGAPALTNISPLAVTSARIGQYVVIVSDEVVGYFSTPAAASTEAAKYASSLVWQVGVPRGIAPIHPH